MITEAVLTILFNMKKRGLVKEMQQWSREQQTAAGVTQSIVYVFCSVVPTSTTPLTVT